MRITTFVDGRYFAYLCLLLPERGERRHSLSGVRVEPLEAGGVRLIGTDGKRIGVFRDPHGFTECARTIRLPIEARVMALRGSFSRLALFGDPSDENPRVQAHVVDAAGISMTELSHIAKDITHKRVRWAGAAEMVDADYPSWQRVFHQQDGLVARPVCLNAAFLYDFHRIAAQLPGGPGLRLYAHGEDQPISVLLSDPNFAGRLMPRRSGTGQDDAPGGRVPLPEWVMA